MNLTTLLPVCLLFFTLITVHCQKERLSANTFEALKNITASENDVLPQSLFNSRDITKADLVAELDDWEAPEWMRLNYPCYLSGYDYDNRPIWVVEMGKYQMRKLVDMGTDAMLTFDKYVLKHTKVIFESHKHRNPEGYQANFILDFDGLRFEQFAHIPTTAYIIHLARSYRQMLEDHTEIAVVLNANFVTETLISLVRPVFAGILRVTEVYGNNKARWLPRMLRLFPKESLPEWYGGAKDWQPIIVRG